MKLRNKKTGEIIEIDNFCFPRSANPKWIYSLEELNENWEDYEEPKKHYEILAMGAVLEQEDAEDEIFRNQEQREIGNYFETKEEAEKAVEKLKAWKRLKDKGFIFSCWDKRSTWAGLPDVKALEHLVDIVGVLPDNIDEFRDDLDLLFRSGE